MRIWRFFGWLVLFGAAQPYILHAQSSPAPKALTVVQSASSFQSITSEPLVVSDNAGGTFVVYRNRRASGGSVQLFVQRIHPWTAETQWAKDGVNVCPQASNQMQPTACLDGEDGLIVAWQDSRAGLGQNRIYAQRFSATGEHLWPIEGVLVSGTQGGDCKNPKIVTDGLGGCVVVWETSTPIKSDNSNSYVIFAQRVGPNGSLVWGDSKLALPIPTNAGACKNVKAVESPEGGALVVWEQLNELKIWELRAQKLGVNGYGLWLNNGIVLKLESHIGQRNAVSMSDGFGGLICVYEEVDKTGDIDIWMTRVGATGNMLFDKPVYQGVGLQEEVTAVKKSGKVVVAWADERSGDRNIYLQWVEIGAGLIEGPADGWPVCLATGRQHQPKFSPASIFYEPILTWMDDREADSSALYCQVLEDGGNPLWEVNGLKINTKHKLEATNDVHSWAVGTDEHGGCWVVFLEELNGGFNSPQYQHIQGDGTPYIPGGGLPLCASHTSGTVKLNNPVMIQGTANDLYIAWEDYRNGQQNADVFIQRVRANGSMVFGDGGKAVCASSSSQLSPTLCAASGGVYIAWLDASKPFEEDIYIQFVDSTGKLRWATTGIAICTAERSQSGIRMTLLPDQSVRIFWTDGRTFDDSGFDIYEQVVGLDGKIRLPENGRLYAGGGGYQTGFEIATLDHESVGIYMDDQSNYYNLIVKRDKVADDKPIWPAKPLVKMNVHQRFPDIKTADNHLYISWVDDRFGFNNSKAYIQKLNNFGSPVWSLSGIQATTEAGKHTHPQIVPDGAGGAYLGWLISYDYDKTKYALYAQQFDANGFPRWEARGKLLGIGLNEHANFSIQRVPSGIAYCWLQPTDGKDPAQVLYLEMAGGDGMIKRNEKFGTSEAKLDKASFCSFANGKRAVLYLEVEPQNSTYSLQLRLF